MPTYDVLPVERRPAVTLIQWRSIEVPLRGHGLPWTLHLCGWSSEDGQGQVSSPVTLLDAAAGTFESSSGRIYRLKGPPGTHPDAAYVWRRWKTRWHVLDVRHLSNSIFERMRVAQEENEGNA